MPRMLNLVKPIYRLSRLQFFLYTLAYYLFVLVVGFVIGATGGAGGWIGLLVGLVFFFLYLHYIARARLQDMGRNPWWALTILIPLVILPWWTFTALLPVTFLFVLCMVLVLLFFPGNQSANQVSPEGVPKIVTVGAGLLAAPIILAGGLVTAFVFLTAISTCFVSAWGCEDYGSTAALLAETETIQTAMYAMMADKNITAVSANNDKTGSLGVNTWTGLPNGPDAAALDGYLRKDTTLFYYCWDSKGHVYAQNKKDGVKAEPDDAEKQRPCKKSLTDPTAQIAEPAPRFLPRLYDRVFRRNLLVITNSTVKPRGRLTTYGPDKAPFNLDGFIVLAAGEEAVRLAGPPVSATGQATLEDLFELEDHAILKRDGGFSVRVNSRLRYEVTIGRFQDGLHLSRVEINRQGRVLESQFTFLAHPGGEGGERVEIIPIVAGMRLAATRPVGIIVRKDYPNVESLVEEYRLMPIIRTPIPLNKLIGSACAGILRYRNAKNDSGTFVTSMEPLPVAVGDYINITGSTYYNGRWEVLQMVSYGDFGEYRIGKKWPGPLSEDHPRVCTD